jgi:SulP family sulfate permease
MVIVLGLRRGSRGLVDVKAWLKSNIPVMEWLPRYQRKDLKIDLIAGLTVGAVVIPSAMGWASLAGLPTQYGLYAAVASLIAYFIFGSSKHLVVVPSSGPAALVGAGLMGLVFADENQYIAAVAMLAFITGLMLIMARVVKLGFIVNFISQTVLIGFQIGLAFYVINLQLGRILGISGASGNFFEVAFYYIENIGEASLTTFSIALMAFALIFIGKRFYRKIPWNFVLIIVATALATLLPVEEWGLDVVGSIPEGLPDFVVPSTGGQSLTALITIAVGLFLITYIEGVSVSKTFARKGGYEVDNNQEFTGYGTANLAASFFQGMPLNGSASNTAINYENHAKSQLSGAVAAVVLILVLLFFTSFFSNLPRVIIGVIIITAMLTLIDIRSMKSVYAFDKKEFAFALAAILGVLFFGLLEGIFIGVALTMLDLLYRISQPGIRQLGRIPGTFEFTDLDRNPENETITGVVVFRVDGPLMFPNVARVRQEVLGQVGEKHDVKLVVLSLRSSPYLDLSATEMIANLYTELRDLGAELRLADASGSCRDSIRQAGLEEKLGVLNPGMSIQKVIEQWFQESSSTSRPG